MHDEHRSFLLIAALTTLLVFCGESNGQVQKDPHRPACTSARCLRIKSFVKAHYCGAPEGNGPEDSCAIRRPKTLGGGVKVTSDFECKWTEGRRTCRQNGQPSSDVRGLLIDELRSLGLPARASGQIYFTVWESTSAGWSLGEAYYDHVAGTNLLLCEVIAIIDRSSHLHVARKVPFQKTDVDVPAVTTWSLVDLADVDGDGNVEIILEGDAYEDHWLEVDTAQDGSPQTIFSGLGYYL